MDGNSLQYHLLEATPSVEGNGSVGAESVAIFIPRVCTGAPNMGIRCWREKREREGVMSGVEECVV